MKLAVFLPLVSIRWIGLCGFTAALCNGSFGLCFVSDSQLEVVVSALQEIFCKRHNKVTWSACVLSRNCFIVLFRELFSIFLISLLFIVVLWLRHACTSAGSPHSNDYARVWRHVRGGGTALKQRASRRGRYSVTAWHVSIRRQVALPRPNYRHLTLHFVWRQCQPDLPTLLILHFYFKY